MSRMIVSLFVALTIVGPVWSQEPVVWVDVYIPRDAVSGEYSGMITIMADGARLGSIRRTVRVESFTLPDKIAMRSNFGSLGDRLARHLGMDAGSREFAAVEDEYIDTLLAHRAIPSSLGNIWPRWTPEAGIDDSSSGELIREALEDFEYMTLAAHQGHQEEVDEIVGSLTQSFNDWSASPDAWQAARAKIAALIAAE